jgi:outer membrane protein
MRHAPFLLSVVLATSALVSPVFAQSLEEEARNAISTSPVLAAERDRLEAVRESRPIAWAELLPQISVDGNAVEAERSEPFLAFNVRDQPEYWIASLRVSTMLFGSGRVWASTRQARAQIASAVALYQDAVQNLTLDLTRAYGETRYSRAVLEAQEQSLVNLQEQERFARANLREGFLTRTDVAQAEARVALARADLARARSRVVEASEVFMRIAGHPPGALAPPASLTGLPESLDVALEAAEEHPALVSAIANVAVQDAAVDLAASNGRLRVFLESTNSRFDVIGEGGDFTEQSEDTVGVRVSVPLFAGGSIRARTRQQRHLRDAAHHDLADTQRRVRERVTIAWSELDATRARLEASQARLQAAELASRGVRREQQFGQRSMIDVLNQEQELLSARTSLAEAERDAMVAERSYAASVGRIVTLLGLGRPRG